MIMAYCEAERQAHAAAHRAIASGDVVEWRRAPQGGGWQVTRVGSGIWHTLQCYSGPACQKQMRPATPGFQGSRSTLVDSRGRVHIQACGGPEGAFSFRSPLEPPQLYNNCKESLGEVQPGDMLWIHHAKAGWYQHVVISPRYELHIQGQVHMRCIDGEDVQVDLRRYLWCREPPISADTMTSRGRGVHHHPAGWALVEDSDTNLNPPVSHTVLLGERFSQRQFELHSGPHQVGALVYDASPNRFHAWALCAWVSEGKCQLVYVGLEDGPNGSWRTRGPMSCTNSGLCWVGSSLYDMEQCPALLHRKGVLPKSRALAQLCSQLLCLDTVADSLSLTHGPEVFSPEWATQSLEWEQLCASCPCCKTCSSLLQRFWKALQHAPFGDPKAVRQVGQQVKKATTEQELERAMLAIESLLGKLPERSKRKARPRDYSLHWNLPACIDFAMRHPVVAMCVPAVARAPVKFDWSKFSVFRIVSVGAGLAPAFYVLMWMKKTHRIPPDLRLECHYFEVDPACIAIIKSYWGDPYWGDLVVDASMSGVKLPTPSKDAIILRGSMHGVDVRQMHIDYLDISVDCQQFSSQGNKQGLDAFVFEMHELFRHQLGLPGRASDTFKSSTLQLQSGLSFQNAAIETNPLCKVLHEMVVIKSSAENGDTWRKWVTIHKLSKNTLLQTTDFKMHSRSRWIAGFDNIPPIPENLDGMGSRFQDVCVDEFGNTTACARGWKAHCVTTGCATRGIKSTATSQTAEATVITNERDFDRRQAAYNIVYDVVKEAYVSQSLFSTELMMGWNLSGMKSGFLTSSGVSLNQALERAAKQIDVDLLVHVHGQWHVGPHNNRCSIQGLLAWRFGGRGSLPQTAYATGALVSSPRPLSCTDTTLSDSGRLLMTTPFSPGLLAGGLPDMPLADLHHTANHAMASGLALKLVVKEDAKGSTEIRVGTLFKDLCGTVGAEKGFEKRDAQGREPGKEQQQERERAVFVQLGNQEKTPVFAGLRAVCLKYARVAHLGNEMDVSVFAGARVQDGVFDCFPSRCPQDKKVAASHRFVSRQLSEHCQRLVEGMCEQTDTNQCIKAMRKRWGHRCSVPLICSPYNVVELVRPHPGTRRSHTAIAHTDGQYVGWSVVICVCGTVNMVFPRHQLCVKLSTGDSLFFDASLSHCANSWSPSMALYMHMSMAPFRRADVVIKHAPWLWGQGWGAADLDDEHLPVSVRIRRRVQDADSAYPNFSGTQIIERLVMHNNLRSAKWLAAYLLSLKDRRVLSNDPIDWLGAQIEKEPVTELRKHFIESAKSQLVTLLDAIAQSRDSTQQEADTFAQTGVLPGMDFGVKVRQYATLPAAVVGDGETRVVNGPGRVAARVRGQESPSEEEQEEVPLPVLEQGGTESLQQEKQPEVVTAQSDAPDAAARANCGSSRDVFEANSNAALEKQNLQSAPKVAQNGGSSQKRQRVLPKYTGEVRCDG